MERKYPLLPQASSSSMSPHNQDFNGKQPVLQGLQWPTAILLQASQNRLRALKPALCGLITLRNALHYMDDQILQAQRIKDIF